MHRRRAWYDREEKRREVYSQKHSSPEVVADDSEVHLSLDSLLGWVLTKMRGDAMLGDGERANVDGGLEDGEERTPGETREV